MDNKLWNILVTIVLIASVYHTSVALSNHNDLAVTGWMVAFFMTFASYRNKNE